MADDVAVTDGFVRRIVVSLTTLALLGVLLDAPTGLRVPAVMMFTLFGPGLAAGRFVPVQRWVDQLAVAGAMSLSMVILISVGVAAFTRWTGDQALAIVAFLSLGLVAIPIGRPRSSRKEASLRASTSRRDDRAALSARLISEDPNERRRALVELSWFLDDAGRAGEAAKLRELARNPVPPRLSKSQEARADGATSEVELSEALRRARSGDPDTRQRGVFELSQILDGAGRTTESESLRAIASESPPGPNSGI